MGILFPVTFYGDKKLDPGWVQSLYHRGKKQKEKIPFGPADIKRSFVALVSRGLITREEVDKQSQWQVTKLAISMLKNLGVIVACSP